jgi:hypothetical protein
VKKVKKREISYCAIRRGPGKREQRPGIRAIAFESLKGTGFSPYVHALNRRGL